eukprot:2359733-Prorocentrum_lima.AAC.1
MPSALVPLPRHDNGNIHRHTQAIVVDETVVGPSHGPFTSFRYGQFRRSLLGEGAHVDLRGLPV